jgi:signal transduction histidine kinase
MDDVESASSSFNCFNNTVQRVSPVNSYLSGTIEPVVTQEHQSVLMQYSAQSAQLGQQITQIILTTQDPQILLTRIAKALGEFFQVDACFIGTIANPTAREQIAFWCASRYPVQTLGLQEQLIEQLMLTDRFTGAEPLAIRDCQTPDVCQSLGWGFEVLPARAILRIHTRLQSTVNGMIVLGRMQPHEWTNKEKELVSAAAQSVAIAISQAQMSRQVQAAARHQTLLNELSLAIRNGLALEEIFQIAIAQTAQALQVNRSLLLLLKYTDPLHKSRSWEYLPKTRVTVIGEWFEKVTGRSTLATRTPKTLLNQSFWLSESFLCQQAFRNAPEPLAISNEREVSMTDVSSPECFSMFDLEMMPATVIVPLVGTYRHTPSAATVLGFLVLQHDQPRLWHPDEIELVKSVSTQVSTITIQQQTLQQVQSLVEDRTVQLQHSLEVQAKLYEKTRQQIDQLQHLNQLKEEFMSSMSHELRTPLTTMSLAVRMLRQPELSPERRDKYLQILEQECNREIDLIEDLLSLQWLESDQSQISLQKIDLMLLIEKLAQAFNEKWADKRLTLRVESPARSERVRKTRSPSVRETQSPSVRETQSPSVRETQSLFINTEPDSLKRILLELLTNAGKYSDPDTTVHLKVAQQVQQSVNQVVLTLTNTGPGISPTDLEHIFDKFRRGRGVTQNAVQGTGLGLALVKCLVQHLNGSIDVSSYPIDNSQTALTSFTVTLPSVNSHTKI